MDVSPIAGKGKSKRAALSSAYLQGVARVCQQQTFPYTGILLEFKQHTMAKKTCPAARQAGVHPTFEQGMLADGDSSTPAGLGGCSAGGWAELSEDK